MFAGMGFKTRSHTLDLSAVGIDNASEWLAESLAEVGAEKSDCTRMRLLFEEALLNLADRFGTEKRAQAYLEGRLGNYRLRLVVEGERFNPLGSQEEEQGDEPSLFAVIGLRAHYFYSKGANVVRMSMPRTPMNPVLRIAIALVLGAFIGLLGNLLVLDAVQEAFCGAVLAPISDMWVRLLQAVSGPVIFLTALTATFDMRRINDLGGSQVSTIARYFGISAVVVLFTLLSSYSFFPLDVSFTEANGNMITSMLDGALKVVPENLVEPFVSANTPQLLIIAIVTGYILASMDASVGELKKLIEQLNMLGLTVARLVCNLVPFFAALLLCLKIWTHDTALLGGIWFPLVLSSVLSVVVLAVALLVAFVRYRVSPFNLMRKLGGAFVEALKRGTLDFSAVDGLAASCKKHLGIDSGFARATLPTGLFLYMPTSALGICVFVLFAAQVQQLHVDQVWFVSVAVLSVVLAVATPPVTGANLLSFVAAFSYLGISSDAFLDVMVFDLVFGVLCIAFDQAMLQINMITQAERMGFLREDVLRAPYVEES